MSSSKYETMVTLPTNGNLYGDGGPEEIILRSMTTQEEKMLYGSTSGDDRLRRIIKACVVSPKDLDLNSLVFEDYHFLLMKLRIHTYGSEYKIEPICPHCNHSMKMTVNLDDFPVDILPDDFEEPIKMTLPMSKDVIECKLLRLKDSNNAMNQARKVTRDSTVATPEEVAFMYRIAKQIVSVNGEEYDFGHMVQYVQDMHARDSAFMRWTINQIKLGYDTTIEIDECPNCGEYYEVTLPMTGEFFRPSFD